MFRIQSYLLLGAKDQRLGAEQDQLPWGRLEPLLATIKRRKRAWFGHVPHHDSLSKTILQDTLEGGRRRGRQRKNLMDNIQEWTKSAQAKTVHKGLLQKRLEEELC